MPLYMVQAICQASTALFDRMESKDKAAVVETISKYGFETVLTICGIFLILSLCGKKPYLKCGKLTAGVK